MDIKYFKSGSYKKQYEYSSFMPELVNHDWEINNGKLQSLLSQADRKLGELSALSEHVPDLDFFIKMYVCKEATMSSRIEGMQTNMTEALQSKETIEPERRDDWQEVQNYILAMNGAINDLGTLPLSNRLLKKAHKQLLQSVRGKHKEPGEFRKSQNWIGGASINDAVFIPPRQDDLPALLTDLEKFINNDELNVPDLIRVAIAHYQFETIHPFLDGNGRVGRLLITLYLVNKGLLVKPALYLSSFFEKHRLLYYDNLTRVRTHNDLTQWLLFFVEGIKQTAEHSIEIFNRIIKLRQQCEEKIATLGKKVENAKKLLTDLYRNPVISVMSVADMLAVDRSTAQRLIKDFIELGILQELTGFKRNRSFCFEAYLLLFERDMV